MLKQPKNIYNIFYLSQKSQKKKQNKMKWKREPQKIKKQNIMNGHRNENYDEEWWILQYMNICIIYILKMEIGKPV